MNIISISSNPLISLSAMYPYDNSFDFQPIYHFDSNSGYYGVSNPLLNNIKDVKIINNSLFYITSAVDLSQTINGITEYIDLTDMVIITGLKSSNNTYFKISESYILGTETEYENRSLFRFIKNNDNTYNIIDINQKYWTIDLNSPWKIKLENKIDDDEYNQQKFILEYNNNSIYIKTKFKNINYPSFEPEYYERFLAIDEIDGKLEATGFIVDDKDVYLYNMVDFSVGSLSKGYSPKSSYIKYYNEFENPENNTNLEFKDIIPNIKQNLLVDSPYKTNIDISNKNFNINIANLKNIKTPEYDYAIAPYFVDNTLTELTSSNKVDAVKRREYNQLFVGSNQDNGYLNPFLSFNSNTKELLFKSDKIIYFHYPKTAPNNIPIQSAGFIESGAVPSNTPARSDKIWKKLSNYEQNIWWGNSTHTAISNISSLNIPVQQGTWLCSWLSGNASNSVSGQWMDRWYYPGFITVNNALTLDTTFIPTTGIYVWDEPSQMTLDGGCWYKYFHFGSTENDKIITSLNGVGLTSLKLNYNEFDGKNVIDDSIYSNNGVINNYSTDITNNNELILDGNDTYTLVPYNSSYKVTDKLSVLSTIKFSDWENINGHHILSNGLNNGWNVKYTNGYFNPIITLYEKTYGHIIFININGDLYYDTLYPVSAHPISGSFYGKPTALQMDDNLSIWATNNAINNKSLYKISYDGIINNEITFDSNVNLTNISLDSYKNAWVLDSITNTISGFTPSLDYIDTISLYSVSGVNRIDFDTQNNFISGDYTILDRCFDTQNNIYELRLNDNYIYKNNIELYPSSGITNILCDSNDRLWLLKDGNLVIKTTTTGTGNEFIKAIGSYTTGTKRMFFTNEYSGGTYKDFLWVLHTVDNTLYKVNSNGELILSLNLSDYIDTISIKSSGQDRTKMLFDIKGNPNNFDWQNKYNSHIPRIEAIVTLNETYTSGVTLSYPASNFVDNEYYNIAFTYNSLNSDGKLYINSNLVDSVSSDINNEIYYKYNSSMIIGGDMGINTSLNDELNYNKYSINGTIKDLRIYNSILNNFDIKHVELIDIDFHDMKWNMPIGDQSFIEEIERFFKHKLPGSKSHFYNIRLSNLNITNTETREIIEEIIRNTVKRVAPIYTELYKIVWE